MGNAYWVLFAASRLHDGLSYVWDTLHSTTMYNALQLPTMIETFGEEPAQDINALSIIGSSLVVASGFMGAMPAVSAVSTMLIGAFGLASQFSNLPPPDPTAKVSEQLSTAFNNAASSIETMVSVIYGGDTDVPTTSLPGQTGNFQTALARFFADGKFLVQDAESFDSAGTSLRDKWIYYQQVQIAGFLMKAYGYVVAVDKTVDNPDGCRSMHSSWWDGTLNKCFYTVKKTDGV
jgi:hypothetical protein